jgi:hypothetical protein
MEISDSIFALSFGKIGVYGLICPDFLVWALDSYNIPFARFSKNKEMSESILALPPGINCMGSAHICIPRFTCSCLFEFPLWALTEQRFTILHFISSCYCLFPIWALTERKKGSWDTPRFGPGTIVC